MRSDPPQPRIASAVDPANGFDALLASARLLQRNGDGADNRRLLLHGRNLGLVCESEDDPSARLFRSAALALGASVSHIRPDLSLPADGAGTGLLDTAVLGRLYDGIECQGLAPAVVRQLGREAGVPVFDGVACTGHPTARLADQLDGADSPEKKRQWILQAALLAALR
jgi:ornithine carbamoyltransferase